MREIVDNYAYLVDIMNDQASLIKGFPKITVNKLLSGYQKCYFW